MSQRAVTLAIEQPALSQREWLPQRLSLFAVMTVACCGATLAHFLSGSTGQWLSIAAIAIAMWHGAYDHIQAEYVLARPLGRHWLAWFLSGYAALAALTFLGWQMAPLISLMLFLLYSAWHFGTESDQRPPAVLPAFTGLALGAVPIVAACAWHAESVSLIFAQMLHSGPASVVRAQALTRAAGLACWPVLAAAGAGIIFGQTGQGTAQRLELSASFVLTIALFAICDPLAAFAVYFCCWHTPEHLVATSLPPATLGGNLRAGLIPWLLSLGLLALVYVLGRHEAASYRAELFVFLSALTVPHMALNELRRAQHADGGSQ